MHLGHPVAQAVHDQLERLGIAHVEAVAGAGGVVVEAGIVVHQPVVAAVVQALERQGGTQVVALGGVVVDHVEDDLDAGGVEGLDHGLELLDLAPGVPRRRVGPVGGEEADRVVAPVVAQAPLLEVLVVDELVDRHQFHRRHAHQGQVVDGLGRGHGRVGAPHLGGDGGVQGGEALDVDLIDHGLVQGDVGGPVVAPVEGGVHDHRQGHVGPAVGGARAVLVAEHVGEHLLAPAHLPGDGLGVGIEQQLGRVAAQAGGRIPRPVDAVAVALTGPHSGQVAVPAEGADLGQGDPLLPAGVVEQAQLDSFGHRAVHGEVGAPVVGSGTQGVGPPRPNLHRPLRTPGARATINRPWRVPGRGRSGR